MFEKRAAIGRVAHGIVLIRRGCVDWSIATSLTTPVAAMQVSRWMRLSRRLSPGERHLAAVKSPARLRQAWRTAFVAGQHCRSTLGSTRPLAPSSHARDRCWRRRGRISHRAPALERRSQRDRDREERRQRASPASQAQCHGRARQRRQCRGAGTCGHRASRFVHCRDRPGRSEPGGLHAGPRARHQADHRADQEPGIHLGRLGPQRAADWESIC